MAFVNFLQTFYPVGSVYFSTTATSPASLIGGTWSQIKGAVLALTGKNSFAGAASYGGSLTMSTNQMPAHSHGAQHASADETDFCFTLNRNTDTEAVKRANVAVDSSSPYVVMASNTDASDSIGYNDIGQASNTKSTGGGSSFFHIIFQFMDGIALPNLFGGEINGVC